MDLGEASFYVVLVVEVPSTHLFLHMMFHINIYDIRALSKDEQTERLINGEFEKVKSKLSKEELEEMENNRRNGIDLTLNSNCITSILLKESRE